MPAAHQTTTRGGYTDSPKAYVSRMELSSSPQTCSSSSLLEWMAQHLRYGPWLLSLPYSILGKIDCTALILLLIHLPSPVPHPFSPESKWVNFTPYWIHSPHCCWKVISKTLQGPAQHPCMRDCSLWDTVTILSIPGPLWSVPRNHSSQRCQAVQRVRKHGRYSKNRCRFRVLGCQYQVTVSGNTDCKEPSSLFTNPSCTLKTPVELIKLLLDPTPDQLDHNVWGKSPAVLFLFLIHHYYRLNGLIK